MSVPLVVVMGVSGAGKTAVGEALAVELRVPFLDGDALHPESNVAKMSAGQPLGDEDRWPWLAAVGSALAQAPDGLVVACSALKAAYRDAIRAAAPRTFFVHLHGTRELHAERIGGRAGHFMPPALLASQLAALEPLLATERGVVIDIALPIGGVVAEARAASDAFSAAAELS